MGVIARKRNGAWWIFINHRGQRRAKRVGSKEAAIKLKSEIEAHLNAGDLGIFEKPGLIFTAATERWLEGHVKPYLKPRSHELYSMITRRYLLPALGSLLLRDISRSRLKELMTALHAKGLSRRYISLILAVLSGIFQQAVEDGNLDHNPAARMGRYTRRSETEDNEQIKFWTQDQLTRILARTKQDYPEWYDLFATLAWSGFRVGEALGLQWDDIDQEERAIYIRRTVDRGQVGPPKGSKSRRVEMAERLVRLLADRKSRTEAETALKGHAPSPWVFPETSSRPVSYDRVCHTLSHILDLEKIPRYSRVMTHAFRHSWATWILQNAPTPAAILYVSRQLGHSTVKLTLDTYSHVLPQENRHLSELLAEATSGTQVPATQAQPEGSLVSETPNPKRPSSQPHKTSS